MGKLRLFLTSILSALLLSLSALAPAMAVEPDVRVFVPDVPGGVVVSNCYWSVGPIYGKQSISFCLKQNGTYRITGGGANCSGRLTWKVQGPGVAIQLRRTSCGRGVAWSADSIYCRPSLVLGFIASLLKEKRPLLDNLKCDYTPARGTGYKKTSFVAHRR